MAEKKQIGYIWDTVLEGNTCTACMQLSGKKFYFNRSGMKPLPPMHPNCRCSIHPIYEDGSHEPVVTFKEWSQKPENQDELKEALGPSRYKLFTDGKLKIERFNSVELEPLNLSEMQKRSGIAFDKAGVVPPTPKPDISEVTSAATALAKKTYGKAPTQTDLEAESIKSVLDMYLEKGESYEEMVERIYKKDKPLALMLDGLLQYMQSIE